MNYVKMPVLNLKQFTDKIKYRGPDATISYNILKNGAIVQYVFHRLSIVNVKANNMLKSSRTILNCNGEIFNYKKLIQKYSLNTKFNSDCEVILCLYDKFTFNSTKTPEEAIKLILKEIEGEFAFVLYDTLNNKMIAARDPFGVRPLFYSSEDGLHYASELKALLYLKDVEQFPPGHYKINNAQPEVFYKISFEKLLIEPTEDIIHYNIRTILTKAVEIRTMSDRAIGCLLSGGLDSSLILALLCRYYSDIHCFSIGLNEEAYDIQAAKKVVKFLNDKGHNITHHIIKFTPEQGFNVLKDVIYHLETRCITTIRAGIPNYLLAKYITENTDIKVIYSGSGSDELFNGYQYGKMITDEKILEEDAARLLQELHLYDNLRDDRASAAHGLEIRVPFLDPHLVNYIFSIPAKYRLSNKKMEKSLLRDAFSEENILPYDILYRHKEAFSDAVSSEKICWYKTLAKKYIEPLISDKELTASKYTFDPPKTKEALYYRNVFETLYPGRSSIIKKIWMPPANIVGEELLDPSATILPIYEH